MARIRYIKPDFFRDEHLKDLPMAARLLFAGLWTVADREGRLEDRPTRLKVDLMPYDKVDINRLLDMLATPKDKIYRPFIYRYEVEGEKYIQIVNWHKHQKPHHTENPSIIPPYIPPLNTKENGDGECASPKLEKSIGFLTVKQRLLNGRKDKIQHLDLVFLTPEEYDKLLQRFGEVSTKDYIERLNNYIGSKGDRYNSHYHTILNWERRDNPTKAPKMQSAAERII